MYLPEVVYGLQVGESFRHVENDVEQRLISLNNGLEFEHHVSGPNGGGAATLSITILGNGRWPTEGYELFDGK